MSSDPVRVAFKEVLEPFEGLMLDGSLIETLADVAKRVLLSQSPPCKPRDTSESEGECSKCHQFKAEARVAMDRCVDAILSHRESVQRLESLKNRLRLSSPLVSPRPRYQSPPPLRRPSPPSRKASTVVAKDNRPPSLSSESVSVLYWLYERLTVERTWGSWCCEAELKDSWATETAETSGIPLKVFKGKVLPHLSLGAIVTPQDWCNLGKVIRRFSADLDERNKTSLVKVAERALIQVNDKENI